MCESFRRKIQSLSKNQQNTLMAVLILINIVIVIFCINFWLSCKKVAPPIGGEKPVGKTIEEQLRELDALRKNISPLTEEEKKQQLKELETIHKETEPLTEEQTRKQLEELNSFHKIQ